MAGAEFWVALIGGAAATGAVAVGTMQLRLARIASETQVLEAIYSRVERAAPDRVLLRYAQTQPSTLALITAGEDENLKTAEPQVHAAVHNLLRQYHYIGFLLNHLGWQRKLVRRIAEEGWATIAWLHNLLEPYRLKLCATKGRDYKAGFDLLYRRAKGHAPPTVPSLPDQTGPPDNAEAGPT